MRATGRREPLAVSASLPRVRKENLSRPADLRAAATHQVESGGGPPCYWPRPSALYRPARLNAVTLVSCPQHSPLLFSSLLSRPQLMSSALISLGYRLQFCETCAHVRRRKDGREDAAVAAYKDSRVHFGYCTERSEMLPH